MVFSPKLEGGVAYNQPVQQPNAMSAIADLFNFGVDTMVKSAASAPKLTEDERFAVAVKDFEEAKGATFNWDRKGMREFIFTHPQFTTQAKTYAENLGVMTAEPTEIARDAAVEWFKTPEGMMAVAATEGMEPEERDAELARRVTTVKQQEAELARLQRETATLEAEGTLDAKRWDVLKPTSKDMVDDTVSTVLAPIVQEVMNGVAVDVPPELAQQLGIRYATIDMNNLPAVLADTKNYLTKQARGAYTNNFGEDLLPSDDWNKEVFASLDSLIEVGKAIDSPQERASAMQAMIESEAYRKMDEAGVAVALHIIKSLPPESAAGLLALPTLNGPLTEILSDGKTLFTTKEIAEHAANLSTKEAGDVARDTIQIIDKGITEEVFTAFNAAAKRSGFNVVDGASFKSIIGNNIERINSLSSRSPDFRAEMSDFLNSDIQQTISIVKSNLPPVVDLVVVNGKMAMVVKPESRKIFDDHNNSLILSGLPPITEDQYIKSQTKGLPDGMNLNTLNEKLGALGLLGDVGKEVQEAIGILNQPEKKATSSNSSSSSSAGTGGLVPEDKWAPIRNGIFAGESGGDYDALFGYANRAGGKYSNVKLTEMTVDEALAFSNPKGEYGNWVKGQVGRIATPMGAYQIVGTTLRAAKEGLGLTGSEVMTPELQDKLGQWIYLQQGTGAWEGYAGPRDSYTPYAGGGTAGAEARMASGTLSLDSGASEVPKGRDGTSTAPTARLQGNLITFDSPEVQQLVEQSQSNPEETVKAAKELLAGKPMDPQVKALIEALVRIGERA